MHLHIFGMYGSMSFLIKFGTVAAKKGRFLSLGRAIRVDWSSGQRLHGSGGVDGNRKNPDPDRWRDRTDGDRKNPDPT